MGRARDKGIVVKRQSTGWLRLEYVADGKTLLSKAFFGYGEAEAKTLFVEQVRVWRSVVPDTVEESVLGRNRWHGLARFEGRLTARRIGQERQEQEEETVKELHKLSVAKLVDMGMDLASCVRFMEFLADRERKLHGETLFSLSVAKAAEAGREAVDLAWKGWQHIAAGASHGEG
jgi:hypothetical protein